MKDKKRKNVLLADFDCDDDWPFLLALKEKDEWTTFKKVSNRNHKGFFSNLKRVLSYFFVGLHFFNHRFNYNKIVAWQQFFGLFFCFFYRFFHSKNDNKVVILTFIFKQKKGLFGRLYKKIIGYSLRAKCIVKICVLSRYEVDFYSNLFRIDSDMFYFTPIGINKKPLFDIKKGNYFLSAGRSNRDYQYLIDAFCRLFPDDSLVIVCDTFHPYILPPNVHVLSDCFGFDYEKMVAECFAVIISLEDDPISSGQLVVEHSFVYKKPVIVTNNPGIVDYVENGVNGYVIEKNDHDFYNAVKNVKNDIIYQRLYEACKPFDERSYALNVSNLFK